jgi:hypothetical protein
MFIRIFTSQIQAKKIPDPGFRSASKNLSIFNPKALGNMIRDVHLDLLLIPDPGVKKAPVPQHWFF